jgi:quinol-cytochrome oxidoreductase complex cytochrome b subunit
MNWSKWIRRTHRWLAVAFTVCVLVNVLVNFVLTGQEQLALWVGLATLVPLFLLLFTGLYLFVLPYTRRGRSPQATDG